MAGKGTDRKGKTKEGKGTNDMAETLAAFVLPDSLPCSEVNFPVLIRKVKRTSWNEILDESKREQQEIEEYVESKREPALKAPFLSQLKSSCRAFNVNGFYCILLNSTYNHDILA